jgi:hypothetical protein
MAIHILSGSGAPVTTPTKIGQHYIDTTNGKPYVSTGTSSSADWKDTTSVGTNTVTNSNLSQVATQTFKGRTTAGTGNVEDLTATQATAMLNEFTSSLKGLVPSSGGGTSNFLRADGTFAVPPGAGAGTTQVTASNTNTALTSSSTTYQQVIGSTNGQRFTLPNATTLTVGTTFYFVNQTPTIIPIFDFGVNLIEIVYPYQYLECEVVDVSTSAGDWFHELALIYSQFLTMIFYRKIQRLVT